MKFFLEQKTASANELMVFCHQFSKLVGASLGIVQAVTCLEMDTESVTKEALIKGIEEAIRQCKTDREAVEAITKLASDVSAEPGVAFVPRSFMGEIVMPALLPTLEHMVVTFLGDFCKANGFSLIDAVKCMHIREADGNIVFFFKPEPKDEAVKPPIH